MMKPNHKQALINRFQQLNNTDALLHIIGQQDKLGNRNISEFKCKSFFASAIHSRISVFTFVDEMQVAYEASYVVYLNYFIVSFRFSGCQGQGTLV